MESFSNIINNFKIKCIQFDNPTKLSIPNVKKQFLNSVNIDDICMLYICVFNLFHTFSNSDKIIKSYLERYNSSSSSTEQMKTYDGIVYRINPGYCLEVVNDGTFRILYTSRIIGGFSIDENGNMIPPPHPINDNGYNKPP